MESEEGRMCRSITVVQTLAVSVTGGVQVLGKQVLITDVWLVI